MKNNLFLILIVVGLLTLIGVQVTSAYDPDRKKFVEACTDYGLYIIEKACKEIRIETAFKAREAKVRSDYKLYCDCLADVWKSNSLKLRPQFFVDVRKAENETSAETKKIQAWIRLPATKSSYAQCHNSSNMNLNWIADEDMKKRKSQSRPK